jgi:hypothetical protein
MHLHLTSYAFYIKKALLFRRALVSYHIPFIGINDTISLTTSWSYTLKGIFYRIAFFVLPGVSSQAMSVRQGPGIFASIASIY